jgi:hypothetical protein
MPQSAFITSPYDFWTQPAPKTGEARAIDAANQSAILELPGALPEKTFEIKDGAITPTQAICIVDTEGGAPADELATMDTTTIHDGAEVTLRAADAARVITLRHGNQPGGLQLIGGANRVLSATSEIRFRLRDGMWHEVAEYLAKSINDKVSVAPTPNTLALRDSAGRIQTGQPVAENDAVRLDFALADVGRISSGDILGLAGSLVPGKWYAVAPGATNIPPEVDLYGMIRKIVYLGRNPGQFHVEWKAAGAANSLYYNFYTPGVGYSGWKCIDSSGAFPSGIFTPFALPPDGGSAIAPGNGHMVLDLSFASVGAAYIGLLGMERVFQYFLVNPGEQRIISIRVKKGESIVVRWGGASAGALTYHASKGEI